MKWGGGDLWSNSRGRSRGKNLVGNKNYSENNNQLYGLIASPFYKWIFTGGILPIHWLLDIQSSRGHLFRCCLHLSPICLLVGDRGHRISNTLHQETLFRPFSLIRRQVCYRSEHLINFSESRILFECVCRLYKSFWVCIFLFVSLEWISIKVCKYYPKSCKNRCRNILYHINRGWGIFYVCCASPIGQHGRLSSLATKLLRARLFYKYLAHCSFIVLHPAVTL